MSDRFLEEGFRPVPKPESNLEIILTSENVNDIFDKTSAIQDKYGERVFVGEYIHPDPISFDKNKLKDSTDTVLKFAFQLHENLYLEPSGIDLRYAFFLKGTPIDVIETAIKSNNIATAEGTWTKDPKTCYRLLALISAVKKGKVTTGRIMYPLSSDAPRYRIYSDEVYAEINDESGKPKITVIK